MPAPRFLTHTIYLDSQQTVGFGSAAVTAYEQNDQVVLSVQLSSAVAAPVTVSYAAADGTALGNGVDYALAPGNLTFAPGETLKVRVRVGLEVGRGACFGGHQAAQRAPPQTRCVQLANCPNLPASLSLGPTAPLWDPRAGITDGLTEREVGCSTLSRLPAFVAALGEVHMPCACRCRSKSVQLPARACRSLSLLLSSTTSCRNPQVNQGACMGLDACAPVCRHAAYSRTHAPLCVRPALALI